MSFLETVQRQQRAAEPDSSVWVAASAGAGKTRVLVDRVLRLLLSGTAPHRILCLTFTRAAAAEMFERINGALGRWAAAGNDAVLAADIRDRLGIAPDAETCAIARRLFAEALDVPGGMKIQTIHAFCESVLGRFPLEAGIAPHFQVMDERSSAEALHEARDAVLQAARDEVDAELAAALAEVTHWVGEDEFEALMRDLVGERGKLRALVSGDDGQRGFARRLREKLKVNAGETGSGVVAAACAEGAFDRDGLRAAAEALAAGSNKDAERGVLIAGWLSGSEEDRVEGFDRYQSAYITGTGTVRKTLITKAAAVQGPGAADCLAREAKRLIGMRERRNAAIVATASEALVNLAAALLDAYENYKSSNAFLDYDDLVLHVRRLLSGPGGASWVMYKLDEGIEHILIDEAQDTNPDQWEVVRALAEEFFAGEGARDGARTVFAVGDAKQSIFSFQRADPEAFSRMRDFFARRVAAAGQRWDTVSLDLSFRSTAPVLRAVDAVFARPAANDGLGAEQVRHTPRRHDQAGRVELWPPVRADLRADPEPWAVPEVVPSEDAPPVRLARGIAGRIREWLDTGERLPARDRALRARDIMVLVRRRTEFVDYLVSALKNLEIPVAGVDRMVLTDQLPIMDLIALGRFLLLPDDDLNLATVLKGPLIGFDETALFDAAYDRGVDSLWQSLRARATGDARLAEAVAYLSDRLAQADFVPPYELFADILNRHSGRERIVQRLGQQANDPIDEFLSLALAFERIHPPSLQGFLQWLVEGKTEIKRDLEQATRDEVRVMTVHGAKGLQAPIVILADTLQVPRQGPRILWSGGDAAPLAFWAPRAATLDPVATILRGDALTRRDQEYRRLLYVAMTRAEDRLYVCGYEPGNGPPEGNWHQLVRDGLAAVATPADMTIDAPGAASWSGEGLVLEALQAGEPDQTDRRETGAGAPPGLPDWARRPPPPEPVPPRPLAPSSPVGDEPAVVSPLTGQGARFRRGLLIHRLLQSLPTLPDREREAAARRFLAHPSHGLDADAQSALLGEALAVLSVPEAAPLFGPRSRAEVPIIGRVGDQVVSGRVDRLAVDDGRVHVVDYKTNRPPPRRDTEVAATYLRQMAAYKAVLGRIYPDFSVECWLLWTDGPILMPLGAAVLGPHAP